MHFSFQSVNPISPRGSVVVSGPLFINSGANVTYNCTAQGEPSNVHVWMLNGMIIEDDNEYNITTEVLDTSSSSELTILNVNAAIHQGRYNCIVSNLGGFGENDILVTGNTEIVT